MADSPTPKYRLDPAAEIVRKGPNEFVLHGGHGAEVFALTLRERQILQLLETARSLDEVRADFQNRYGQVLDVTLLQAFVDQLLYNELLHIVEARAGAESSVSSSAAESPEHETAVKRPTNADQGIWVRFVSDPELVPEPMSGKNQADGINFFFDLMVLFFGWLLHPIWIVPILLMFVVAATAIFQRWARFENELTYCWTMFPFLPFLAFTIAETVLLVNLPRILFIGMIHRSLGGRIRDFYLDLYGGLIFTFHIDLQDSPRFLKHHELHKTVVVDLMAQLAVMSLTVIFWVSSPPGSLLSMLWCSNILVCCAGLLIQANIFQAGSTSYIMLSLCIEEMAFLDRAKAETRQWLFGRPSPEPMPAPQHFWFRVYGLAYYGYWTLSDTMVWLYLFHNFMHKFHGVWQVLGVLAVVTMFIIWYHESLGSLLMLSTTASSSRKNPPAEPPGTHRPEGWFSGLAWQFRWGGSWPVRWGIRLVMAVAVVALGMIPYGHDISGPCRTIPVNQAAVRAQVADEIVQIHVAEGDEVKAGQLIATLSGRQTNAAYLGAIAALEAAQAQRDEMRSGARPEDINAAREKYESMIAQLDFATLHLDRSKRLYAQKAINEQDLQKAQRERDSKLDLMLSYKEQYYKLKSGTREEVIRNAEAKVVTALEELRLQEKLHRLTRITAPMSGTVSSSYMKERLGQSVPVGGKIATIQDRSKLLVEVAADMSAAVEVAKDQKVTVRLDGLEGQRLTGRVVRVAPKADRDSKFGNDALASDDLFKEENLNYNLRSGTSHVRVYVELDEYPVGLMTDMTGYARIVVNEDDSLWRACARPFVRFFRTEVWYWLPG